MARKKKSSAGKRAAAKKQVQKPKVTRYKVEVAPEATAEVTPEVVAEQGIKTEAKRARRKPQVSAAEALPVRPRRLSLAERLAITAGGVFMVVGIVGLLQRPDTSVPVTDVKQQSIPMTMEDFKDDPAIQNAIQKQLGGQSPAAPTPQEQHTQSPQATGTSPQTPAGNLQP